MTEALPAPQAPRRLGDRLRAWRNRMVASEAFQERAARWPILRGIARRRTEALFRLTSGFVRSQILTACVETGLLRALLDEPTEAAPLARRLGLPVEATTRLLDAARAIGLIARDRRGRWWCTDDGTVAASNEGVEAMVRHHAMLYRDLADPARLLREPAAPTETARYWSYAGGAVPSAAEARDYSALMATSQDMLARTVLAAYPMGRHGRVLDVGGGEGAFLAAVGRRHPGIGLHLFDLPEVASRGAAALRAAGLEADATGGDFIADPMPAGADLVTLVRVLCDHDDARALALLSNLRRTMAPGATLLIAEPMDGPGEGESLAAAYFGLYFLAMRSGRCRTPARIVELVREAGFGRATRRATANPLIASLVVATP